MIQTACEDAVFTFDGVSGEKYAWKYTDLQWTGDETLKRPNNTNLSGGHTAGNNHFHDAVTLDATGVFKITNGPRSCATGSGTLEIWRVPENDGDTAVIGGDTGDIEIAVRGQNAWIEFEGTAGQQVAYQATGSNLGEFHASLARPDSGNVFGSYRMSDGGGFKDVFTLPVTGTYRLNINASGENTGTASVQLWEVVDPVTTLTINGGSGTVTTTVPGQDAIFQFEATAGQIISWQATGVNLSNFHASLCAPSGGCSSKGRMTDNGGFEGPMTLTETGTYTIVANASGTNIGSVTLSITE